MSTPTFTKTHNLIAYLEKPTKSEGFVHIIDFLNGSSVKYDLTVSPTIHTSCIKQFWTSAKVKKVNDEVRIQPLVNGKRVNINESSIRRLLRLDDVEGTSCLTNTEIFEGLARMGYEKPSDKLTFYKAFFSPNHYGICHHLSCYQSEIQFLKVHPTKFGQDIEDGVPFFMFPRFVKLIINHQLGDMTHHKDIFDTPSLTKKVFANIKRVGTGFFGEVTQLLDNMLVQAHEEVGILQADAQPIPILTEPSASKPQKKHKPTRKHTKEPEVPPTESQAEHNVPLPSPSHDPLPSDLESEVIDIKSTFKEKIKKLESRVERLEEENMVLKDLKGVHSTVDSDEPVMEKEKSSKQGRKIADIDADVLSMLDVNDEEPADVEKVVTTTKLITKVVTTARVDVNAASVQDTPITAAEATEVTVEVPRPRKRRGVIIQDPEETTTTVTVQPKVQAKDKGKVILIEEPKPLKRQV
uniref:Synaptobrevin, longin-like domain protein n=1 Tax=Tanacetum cinerariifolium TaxID=118510 RepID=A0A6L2NTR3_TANCI|nr:hypothetical protein [Tanacetum cinerariifolium]